MQIRKLSINEKEMANWLNEDYHANNQVKALVAIQNADYELIRTLGDGSDEIIAHSNSFENKINELKSFIIIRRNEKEQMFRNLPVDVKPIMEMHYLGYLTFEKIAEKTNYHVSTVKRKHISGLHLLCGDNNG